MSREYDSEMKRMCMNTHISTMWIGHSHDAQSRLHRDASSQLWNRNDFSDGGSATKAEMGSVLKPRAAELRP